MPEPIPPADIERFYRAALIGLRALDRAQGREVRFGAGADLRWKSFQGHLGTSDRIDLLCRDAAVKWEVAFSPARAFDLTGLAPDEPFGPDWPGLDEPLSAKLWEKTTAAPLASSRDALRDAAHALGAVESPLEGSIASLAPATKLLVGGLFAIWKAAEAFMARPDLRWADQVTVVADRPAERQLAGLVAPLLQAARATRVVAPPGPADALAFTARLTSGDASSDVSRAVRGER